MPTHNSSEHATQKQPRRKKSDKAHRNFDLNGKTTSRHIRIMTEAQAKRQAQKER